MSKGGYIVLTFYRYFRFAVWVARFVFDSNENEFDSALFCELACRKLHKLGLVRRKDGSWELPRWLW